MSKTERKRLLARARHVCLTLLRQPARTYGLKVQRVAGDRIDDTMTNAAFAIGNHVGITMYIRARYVIMGRNGYLSSVPHGDTFHDMGTPEDWENVISDGGVLSYVCFGHGDDLYGDNFYPTDREELKDRLKLLEITPESCAWGKQVLDLRIVKPYPRRPTRVKP